MRKYRTRAVVKDGFRYVMNHNDQEHVYCGECTDLLQRRSAVLFTSIPGTHETLTCHWCKAINPTSAIADEIEIGAEESRKTFKLSKADIRRHNQ